MEILHIAAECYPILKAGGMGDVLGSLPKYQQKLGKSVGVVVPFHDSRYVLENLWEVDYEKHLIFGWNELVIRIWRQTDPKLGFYTFLVEVPGMFPRQEVYGYDDDAQRFVFFQIVVLNWLEQMKEKPKVVHCHDHTTGLIPFFMKHGWNYQSLANIPSVFTIHNGEYQGMFSWSLGRLLPDFDSTKAGFLDYNGLINPMFSAIKSSWATTTVSKGYMEELVNENSSLGETLREQNGNVFGILNGIDDNEWNPENDKYLNHNYTIENFKEGKQKNKEELCFNYGLNSELPLIVFIGRMVHEKGIDYLVPAIWNILSNRNDVCFMIIGSGSQEFETAVEGLKFQFPGNLNTYIGYNEALARLAYAAGDFLLMPSRVEPCGLNQFYAMQYGTIPIVRKVGGLRDTVIDIEDNGEGFTFVQPTIGDLQYGISRALDYKWKKNQFDKHRKKLMEKNFSWTKSAKKYNDLYKSISQ